MGYISLNQQEEGVMNTSKNIFRLVKDVASDWILGGVMTVILVVIFLVTLPLFTS